MSDLRIGLGEDSHLLESGGPLRLGGVDIPHNAHAVGHSDADVLLHAVIDAMLGAAVLPDIGELFPNTLERYRGCDSADLLQQAHQRVADAGWQVVNLDCVVAVQSPKIAPHKAEIRQRIADAISLSIDQVNVKAKTGESVGPVGRGELIESRCIALLEKISQ